MELLDGESDVEVDGTDTDKLYFFVADARGKPATTLKIGTLELQDIPVVVVTPVEKQPMAYGVAKFLHTLLTRGGINSKRARLDCTTGRIALWSGELADPVEETVVSGSKRRIVDLAKSMKEALNDCGGGALGAGAAADRPQPISVAIGVRGLSDEVVRGL